MSNKSALEFFALRIIKGFKKSDDFTQILSVICLIASLVVIFTMAICYISPAVLLIIPVSFVWFLYRQGREE